MVLSTIGTESHYGFSLIKNMQSWAGLILTGVANKGNQIEMYIPPQSLLLKTGLCMEWQGTGDVSHSKALLIPLVHHLVFSENTNYMAAAPTANPQLFSFSRPYPTKSNTSNMPSVQKSRAIWKISKKYIQIISKISKKYPKPKRFHKSCSYSLKVPWPLYILILQMSLGNRGNLWYLP